MGIADDVNDREYQLVTLAVRMTMYELGARTSRPARVYHFVSLDEYSKVRDMVRRNVAAHTTENV